MTVRPLSAPILLSLVCVVQAAESAGGFDQAVKPVLTRIYFPDEADANAADPVLGAIADDAERAMLVARAAGPAAYRFDIRLQGEGQTVFFTTPAFGL